MSQSLAPALRTYAIDPPSPDFQTLFVVIKPQVVFGNPLYQPLIDSLVCAGAYLDGVNKSYDRYSAAYAAGDLASQDLQFGGINSYLGEYGNCMLQASTQMMLVGEMLRNSSQLDNGYDPSMLLLIQDKLRSEGFSVDLVSALQGMGLSQTQIDHVRMDILDFDPLAISGTLSGRFTDTANAFKVIAFDTPAEVSEPSTILLLVTSCFALVWLRSRNERQMSFKRGDLTGAIFS